MATNWKPQHIIWVGDDSGLADHKDRVLLGSFVGVGTEDIAQNPQIPPCFQNAERNRIRTEAGEKWVYNGARDSAHREIHQSLIIASEMGRIAGCAARKQNYSRLKVDELKALIREKDLGPLGKRKKQELIDLLDANEEEAAGGTGLPPVQYWPWAKLAACLQGTSQDTIQDKTLFFFCWSGIPNMPRTHALYNRLDALKDARVRCYPEFGDLHESERKIGDMTALDEIARAAEDVEHQYRPETCFKTQDCTLTQPFVVKRTHSAGGENVELDPAAGRTALLRCQPPVRRSPRITPPPDADDRKLMVNLPVSDATWQYMDANRPIWFHQEKVDSLINLGEFRLIIATLPDKTGLRGCKGAVFEAFHTTPRHGRPSEPLVNTMSRVPATLLSEEFCGQKTYRDLEEYALWVFERLREYGQSQTCLADSTPEPEDEEEEAPACSPGGSRKRPRTAQSASGRPSKAPRLSPEVDETTVESIEARDSASADSSPHSTPPASSPPTRRRSSTSAITDTANDISYSSTIFSSLEVGVRLDIGISSAENGHRFFVNEVTREWYGDLISYKAGEPRTRICKALGEARARVLFPVEEEGEEGEGSSFEGFSDEADGGGDDGEV